ELGGHLQTQRRAVTGWQRLAVHFVTQQRLRMQDRLHVDGLVILVQTLYFQVTRREVGADGPQKIGGPRAAEVSYHVPAFDADVARILNDFGERLNLLELVV